MIRPNSRRTLRKLLISISKTAAALLMIGFLGHEGAAQSHTPSLQERFHQRWTATDGAPGIRSMTQGDDGYLWIGTDHGLFQFDGVTFVASQTTPKNDVLTRTISVVSALPGGGVWIGYESGGASFLKNGHLDTYSIQEGLSSGSINAFAKDKRGDIWAASQYGIARFHGSRWEDVGPHWQYPHDYPNNVFADSRGTIWTSTMAGLSFRRKGEERFIEADPHRLQNVDFSESPDGTVWLASVTGSVRAITTRDGEYTPYGKVFPLRSEGIHIDRDGALWISTVDQGLYRITTPEESGTDARRLGPSDHVGAQDGLTSEYAFQVIQGREGESWIATAKGLDEFREAPLRAIKLLRKSTWESMVTDPSGTLMIASERFAKVERDVAVPMQGGPSNVECVYRDPSGDIWLGSSSQLWRLAGSRFLAQPLPPGFDKNPHVIQAMTMGRDNALWVSYLRDGVYRFKNGKWDHSGAVPRLSGAPANSMLTDSSGHLWFGYVDNHVVLIADGHQTSFGPDQGLAIGSVGSILEIDQRIWVAGTSGLQFMDRGRFRSLCLADADDLRGVAGMAIGQDGALWLNTATGVIQIPSREIKHVLGDPQYKAVANRFSYLDGLTGNPDQPHHHPTVISGRDGRLYFAIQGSVVWLTPMEQTRNLLPPPVWILSATADGTSFREPTTVTLPARTKTLIIDYTATSILIPQRVGFRYRLDGIDSEWQEAGTRREALYSRLPPGHYRFRVIACNNDGVWNQAGAGFNLLIPPAFTQSAGFLALCSIAGLALLWLLYCVRIHQVTQQVKSHLYARVSEREQIARGLHDTFLQGVQSVLLAFHTATKHLKGDDRSRELLDKAFLQSAQVMLEGREIILNLRGEGTDAEDLSHSLSVVGAELSKTQATIFNLVVNGRSCPLNPIVRDEIYRIAREAISNAFHHATADKIEVELTYGIEQLSLSIRDNGSGIDPTILSAGFREKHWGLPGMRERAKLIGAELDLWSQPKAGTEWELRIPMGLASASTRRRPRSFFLPFS